MILALLINLNFEVTLVNCYCESGTLASVRKALYLSPCGFIGAILLKNYQKCFITNIPGRQFINK